MYALSKSILQHVDNYRVELYDMHLLGHDVSVHIELKIFGEGANEVYVGDYQVMKVNGEPIYGTCMNRATKEETIEGIEENVIRLLEDKGNREIFRIE